jgi:hypothetical protein
LSILLLYYRIIKDSSIRWFTWALHASVVFQLCICVTFVFLIIWNCVPIQAYWTWPPMQGARCVDEGVATMFAGVINCVADLGVTILPAPMIMRLQMPLRQRIGVCVLMCLGIVVTAAGAVRTYYIWKALIASYDETWLAYPLYICATVEIDLGVVSTSTCWPTN